MGDWKYLRGYPPGSHQLFNLKTDIKELRDVSHANGAIFSELTSRCESDSCVGGDAVPSCRSGAAHADAIGQSARGTPAKGERVAGIRKSRGQVASEPACVVRR